MKRLIYRLFCIIILALPQISAAEEANYRLCKPEDLVGNTYKMVLFRETPPVLENSFVNSVPYHYLAFYQDNYYSYLAASQEIMLPQNLNQDLLWARKKNHILRYTLDNKGELILYDGKKINYRYRCFAVLSNYEQYIKGDVILSGYAKKSKSQLLKIYRRWY